MTIYFSKVCDAAIYYFTPPSSSTVSIDSDDGEDVFKTIPPVTIPLADVATENKDQFKRDLKSAIASENFKINNRKYRYDLNAFECYISMNKVTILETLRQSCPKGLEDRVPFEAFLEDFPTSLYKVFHQGAFGAMWDDLNEYISPRTGNLVEGEGDFETRKKEIQDEMPPFTVTQGATTYRVHYKVMEEFRCILRVNFDIKSADPENPERKHKIKQIQAQGTYNFFTQTITWKFKEIHHNAAGSASACGVSQTAQNGK